MDCPYTLSPLPEATLDMPAAVIAKTTADTLSCTLLIGKIRLMGNTSLTLYSFPLIQAPL